jgi:hypothetical protein
MSNAEKLESLFELYSGDLARYAPTLKGQFGCPLCLKAVQRHEPLKCVVAEEHIVPSKLGGRATTLTCRKCNNSQGSSLESNLIRQVRIETGKKPYSARIEVGAGEFGANVFLPRNSVSGDLEVEWIPNQSHPARLDAAKAGIRAGGRDLRMRLNYGYNEARARGSLIRSAYLLMFRYFGYRYVLDPSASGLLEVIQDPFLESPVTNATKLQALDTLPDELNLPAIAIVKEPEDRQSFIALLELDREPRRTFSIAVPPLGKDASSYYERLETMCQETQLSLTVIPMPSTGFWPLAEAWSHHTDAT